MTTNMWVWSRAIDDLEVKLPMPSVIAPAPAECKETCISCINAVGVYLNARSQEATTKALAALREAYADVTVATPELGEDARALYGSDEINIDDGALTSVGEDGTWVQAWLWVKG